MSGIILHAAIAERFPAYIDELQKRLFERQPLEEALRNRSMDNHRTERFLDAMILRDKPTFRHYFDRMDELRLAANYSRAIHMLFLHERHTRLASAICGYFVERYGIAPDLSPWQPDAFETRQSLKHIDVFGARLLRMYPELRDRYLGGTPES